MMFAGYSDHNTHGFLVWDPLTHRVKVRYSLIFEEDANMGITIGSKLHRIDGGRRHHRIEIKDPGSEDEAHTPDRIEVQPLMLEGLEDDGWAQIYTVDDEETLEDIGRRIGVDPTEIQRKNTGVKF